MKFAGSVYRTEVCPKSLNPAWPAQWFTFEVDNEVLQDEPLQIRYLYLCYFHDNVVPYT